VELEGFIPVREMSEGQVNEPRDVVQPGQIVEAKVLDLRPESRRMTLSLVEAAQEREREEYRQIMAERRADEPRRTLADAMREAGVTAETIGGGDEGQDEAAEAAEEDKAGGETEAADQSQGDE
ncbi:MAG: S1 RNA-binding domain-containing protein, partial [Armatimonadetes bacterium]|nr:S1 RNA-binding domain-containing protein [Armatimonadota bacterium]